MRIYPNARLNISYFLGKYYWTPNVLFQLVNFVWDSSIEHQDHIFYLLTNGNKTERLFDFFYFDIHAKKFKPQIHFFKKNEVI